MADYTPGPWIVLGAPGKLLCVTDGDSRYVVDRFELGGRPAGEHLANAYLISAAPDLLDEVVRFHANLEADVDDMACNAGNWDGGSSESCEHCQAIMYRDRLAALIVKATGGPP